MTFACWLSFIYGVELEFFFFKQKTAYEVRISDWSSDVCSSDLPAHRSRHADRQLDAAAHSPARSRTEPGPLRRAYGNRRRSTRNGCSHPLRRPNSQLDRKSVV